MLDWCLLLGNVFIWEEVEDCKGGVVYCLGGKIWENEIEEGDELFM